MGIINTNTHKLTVRASGPFLVTADWYLAILSFREVVSRTRSGDNTAGENKTKITHTHRLASRRFLDPDPPPSSAAMSEVTSLH